MMIRASKALPKLMFCFERTAIVCMVVAVFATCIPIAFAVSDTKPTIGTETNVADNLLIQTAGTQYFYKNNNQILINPSVTGGSKANFTNLKFGSSNSFTYSADVTFKADSSSYGRISLFVGKGVSIKDGETKYIEVCIRPKLKHAVIFGSATGAAEEAVAVWGAGCEDLAIGNTYEYTVQYESGIISFWLDGIQMFGGPVDCSSKFTSITPCCGVVSKSCTGTVSNIEIYGDVEIDPDCYAPTIGTQTNVADNLLISMAGSQYADYDNTKQIVIDPSVPGSSRSNFVNLKFGSSNSFTYSADVTFKTDSSTYGRISLLVGKGVSVKDGKTKVIEVCIRPNLKQAVIFAGDNGEEALKAVGCSGISIGNTYRYTVKYDNGKITFWLGDTNIFDGAIDINSQITSITPCCGVISKSCTGTVSNIEIYGDVEIDPDCYAPTIGTQTNVADNLLISMAGSQYADYDNTKQIVIDPSVPGSSRANFVNLKFGSSNSFTYSADVTFKTDSTTYGRISLLVGKGVSVKDGQTKNIEVCIRPNLKQAVIFASGNGEEALKVTGQYCEALSIGNTYRYTVKYDNGKITFWLGDTNIFDGAVDINSQITSITPCCGVISQSCTGTVSNIEIYGDVEINTDCYVPVMPEGNGNYADTMTLKNLSTSKLTYIDGVITNSNASSRRALFERLPFTKDDTFVYSADAMVTEADKTWKGIRFIVRQNDNNNRYYVFLLDGAVAVYQNDKQIASASYTRTLGETDRIDILSAPDSISVWVNNMLVIDNAALPEVYEANLGVWFEQAQGTLSNIKLYYTNPVTYVVPEGPPTIPVFKSGAYNAAQYMKVKNGNTEFKSYFNYSIINNLGQANYKFYNLPLADDATYVYSTDLTVTESTDEWKGPRLLFRTADTGNNYYVCFFQSSIVLLQNNGKIITNYPMKVTVGQSYNIAIQSSTDSVTVWLNGECIFEKIDLSQYDTILNATPGVMFESSKGTLRNIKIYGDDVKYVDGLVDPELIDNIFYNMSTIPSMPEGNINYFENVHAVDNSSGALHSSYVDGVFQNEYPDESGNVKFLDANNNRNLNGLKNSTTFVFQYDYCLDSIGGNSETMKTAGGAFTFRNNIVPANTSTHCVKFSLLKDWAKLEVYINGKVSETYDVPFKTENGVNYKITILSAPTWAKVWIDGELILIATDLPAYNVDLRYTGTLSAVTMKNYKLYNAVKCDDILPAMVTQPLATNMGNTLKDVISTDVPIIIISTSFKAVLALVGIVISIIGIAVLTILLIKRKKGEKLELDSIDEIENQ